MSEWLKIMLDEIARKTREAEEALAERERRSTAAEDGGATEPDDGQAEGK